MLASTAAATRTAAAGIRECRFIIVPASQSQLADDERCYHLSPTGPVRGDTPDRPLRCRVSAQRRAIGGRRSARLCALVSAATALGGLSAGRGKSVHPDPVSPEVDRPVALSARCDGAANAGGLPELFLSAAGLCAAGIGNRAGIFCATS